MCQPMRYYPSCIDDNHDVHLKLLKMLTEIVVCNEDPSVTGIFRRTSTINQPGEMREAIAVSYLRFSKKETNSTILEGKRAANSGAYSEKL